MNLFICLVLFYLCFRIEAYYLNEPGWSSSNLSSSSEEMKLTFDLLRKNAIMNNKSKNNGNVTRFQSDKYIGTSFGAGKLYNQENMDVKIMGTRFEIPKNDEIQIPSYIHHVKSEKNDSISSEKWVPLSLLQIKVFYDDGFLDHPDIKTTHDAINYIMATLEHVQHSMCLSTMGTRLQIEVSICKMLLMMNSMISGEAAKKHTQIKKIAKDVDHKLLMLGI